MKKILITIIIYVFTAKANAQTILLQESFATASLPTGWSIDSAGVVPTKKWNFTGTPANITAGDFSGNYPRIEGHQIYYSDCNLNTGVFNASGVSTVYLSFSEQSSLYPPSSPFSVYGVAKIDVSNDSGMTWVNIDTHAKYNYPFRKAIYDISSVAAGHQNVRVRFNFSSHNNTYIWAIDNVLIADSIHCVAPTDSGWAWSNHAYECTGNMADLYLYNLSRGIGQTYQWQQSNAANGFTFTDVPGAVYDTISILQQGSSYYRCQVGCQGTYAYSNQLFLVDTPTVPVPNSLLPRTGICPGKNDTIFLDYDSTIQNLSFQWGEATSFWGPYSDIAGATNNNYIINANNHLQDTYFKCDLICASNTAYYDTVLNLHVSVQFLNANPYCYCIPLSSGLNCSDTNVVNLEYISIASTSLHQSYIPCVDSNYNDPYVYFAPVGNATATFAPGVTYTITVNVDRKDGNINMWLDSDNNGWFDPYEHTYIGFIANTSNPVTATFTVPVNAVNGLTGLRIRQTRDGMLSTDSLAACEVRFQSSVVDFMVTIDSTVGIADLGIEIGDLRLMPNPAKDKLTITALNFTPTNNAQFIITDLTGRILQQEIFTGTATINTTALTPAVYFVTVKDKERSVVRRFVKEP